MPGWMITSARADEIPYDASEVQKIRTILEKQSMVEGKTNAEIMGITDLNDPGKWTCVNWIENHPDSPVLEPIKLTNKHASSIGLSGSTSGSIEISGFPYLRSFGINNFGGIIGNRGKYEDINVHDNPRLETLGIKYASVGLIKITQNPKLGYVILDLVDTRELILESQALDSFVSTTMGSGSLNFADYPLLRQLQLTDCNHVKTLDLSGCPNIDFLIACRMENLENIRFGSKQDFAAITNENPKLTSLDFRGFQPYKIECNENPLLSSILIDRKSPLSEAAISKNAVLTKLDLSDQPDLEILYCGENSLLSELLLKGDTKLGYIYCNDCALRSLDVSGLSSLKILEASANQLTSFSASAVQFTKLALRENKLKKIVANVSGFNINVKTYKEYGYVGFNTSRDIENPNDLNTYFYIDYDGLDDPDPHTYFREIVGTGLPEGKNAWKSSFPLKSDINVTLYFDCYVHFVSWFESATGDPYDENAILSLRFKAGYPIGPTPPDTTSTFPAECPPPVKKGYTLQGWYKDMALTQPWDLVHDSITSTLVLFPYWVPNGSPMVLSVKRQSPTDENTSANKVIYLVTFSTTVSGVDVSDFKLSTEGSVTGKIASVSAANGNTISVEVNDIAGTGTLRLDVKNTGTGIVDSESNPLAGGYTTGEMYNIGTPTAIADVFQDEKACRVFPNPTSGTIRIDTPENEPIDRVEIFSIQGKRVLVIDQLQDNNLDLNGFPRGIYVVKIQSKTGIYNNKVIVSR
jgi:hypothetical protein